MSASVVRRRVAVRGRVQGVWFRASTRDEALGAGVAGWIRNTGDDAVEAVFEGRPDAVARLVAYVGHGPPRARVERVEVVDEEPEGLRGFEIR